MPHSSYRDRRNRDYSSSPRGKPKLRDHKSRSGRRYREEESDKIPFLDRSGRHSNSDYSDDDGRRRRGSWERRRPNRRRSDYSSDEDRRRRRGRGRDDDRGRGRGYESDRRRNREPQLIQERFTFRYQSFGNVVQILLFGVVGRFMEKYPESDRRTVESPSSYTDMQTNKEAVREQKLCEEGNTKIKKINRQFEKSMPMKTMYKVSLLVPVCDFVLDIVCVLMMKNTLFWLGVLALFFSCRNALIGHFVHTCYIYPLFVKIETFGVLLIPGYWCTLPFASHPFRLQLEFTAWLAGWFAWPVRLALQCYFALRELQNGGEMRVDNTDVQQMGFVNAIARPLPNFLVKYFAYKDGYLSKEIFFLAGALGVLNFSFIWLQHITNGAIRGIKLMQMRHVNAPEQEVHFRIRNGISALAWSPDNRTILIGMRNGYLQTLEVELKQKKKVTSTFSSCLYLDPLWSGRGHRDAISDACFSNCCKLAVTVGLDCKVCVWETHVGGSRRSNDWEWRVLQKHNFHRDSIRVCAMSSNLKWIASGSDDGELICWEWEARDEEELVWQFGSRDKDEGVIMVGFDPNNEKVVGGGDRGSIKVFSLRKHKFSEVICEFNFSTARPNHGVTKLNRGAIGILSAKQRDIQHTSKKTWVAVLCEKVPSEKGEERGQAYVVDLTDGKKKSSMTLVHWGPIGFAAICKDNTHCITSATSCKIWNMSKGSLVANGQMSVRNHDLYEATKACCGGVSPDGRFVALGSKSGVFSIFDFKNKLRPKIISSR